MFSWLITGQSSAGTDFRKSSKESNFRMQYLLRHIISFHKRTTEGQNKDR